MRTKPLAPVPLNRAVTLSRPRSDEEHPQRSLPPVELSVQPVPDAVRSLVRFRPASAPVVSAYLAVPENLKMARSKIRDMAKHVRREAESLALAHAARQSLRSEPNYAGWYGLREYRVRNTAEDLARKHYRHTAEVVEEFMRQNDIEFLVARNPDNSCRNARIATRTAGVPRADLLVDTATEAKSVRILLGQEVADGKFDGLAAGRQVQPVDS